MGFLNISNRYAKALLEIAKEKNILDAVSNDMKLILNTLKESRELKIALKSPIIKENDKLNILKEIFASKVSLESMHFVEFVLEKNRIEILSDISRRFVELVDEIQGFVEVEVASIDLLDNNQKELLKSKLESITNKKVRLSFKIDKNLIGGFTARVKDKVFDASVKHQLENLRKSFLQEHLN
jgi:F-type H+-transporting ATPase subunit delta